mmetsp:Transcript_8868/g.16742  ORF Transcript_8868/g.16742 Transcript_8868/m.16742 type:complete len:86 (-) Transcript_8868:303-560(-)
MGDERDDIQITRNSIRTAAPSVVCRKLPPLHVVSLYPPRLISFSSFAGLASFPRSITIDKILSQTIDDDRYHQLQYFFENRKCFD